MWIRSSPWAGVGRGVEAVALWSRTLSQTRETICDSSPRTFCNVLPKYCVNEFKETQRFVRKLRQKGDVCEGGYAFVRRVVSHRVLECLIWSCERGREGLLSCGCALDCSLTDWQINQITNKRTKKNNFMECGRFWDACIFSASQKFLHIWRNSEPSPSCLQRPDTIYWARLIQFARLSFHF